MANVAFPSQDPSLTLSRVFTVACFAGLVDATEFDVKVTSFPHPRNDGAIVDVFVSTKVVDYALAKLGITAATADRRNAEFCHDAEFSTSYAELTAKPFTYPGKICRYLHIACLDKSGKVFKTKARLLEALKIALEDVKQRGAELAEEQGLFVVEDAPNGFISYLHQACCEPAQAETEADAATDAAQGDADLIEGLQAILVAQDATEQAPQENAADAAESTEAATVTVAAADGAQAEATQVETAQVETDAAAAPCTPYVPYIPEQHMAPSFTINERYFPWASHVLSAQALGRSFEVRAQFFVGNITPTVTIGKDFVDYALAQLGVTYEQVDVFTAEQWGHRTSQGLGEFALAFHVRDYLKDAAFVAHASADALKPLLAATWALTAQGEELLPPEEYGRNFLTRGHNETEHHAINFATGFLIDFAASTEVQAEPQSFMELGNDMAERFATEYQNPDATWAHNLIWGYREHSFHATDNDACVYDAALLRVRAALKSAGLGDACAVEIERELMGRVAARLTEAFTFALSADEEHFARQQRAACDLSATLGRILAQGYGTDLDRYLDPKYLRERFGKTDAHEAKGNAPETACAEVATATQDNAVAPEGAAATVKLLARAVAQAVAAMGLDVSQANLGSAQGDTGEAGGAAAPAPAELDWAEVDASDGFVYGPEGGLEFFTIDDEDDECEDAFCARAQGTLERDAWGESYGYLPVYGDTLESVLEASTLTPEELAARCAAAGTAVVPVVGQAAKALKETAISADSEPSGDACGLMGGGRVLIIGSNAHNKGVHEAAYVDHEAAARSAANPPKAKREKSALNDYQVLDHIPEKPAAEPEVQTTKLSYTWFYFDRSSYLVTCADPFAPCLKADVLKKLERADLFPALCDSSTDKKVLKAAWLALLTRPSVHLDAKQLTIAQAAYDKAKALALDVVTGLHVLQGSMDSLSRTYISVYDAERQRIFAALLDAFPKAAPEFVALRTQMLTPLVAGYMCRFYMYQEAAGRTDARLRDLSLVPLLAAAIAQGVSSTVCFIFAQGFSSACFPILNAACKDAYEELKASGQFCLSSEQSRKYCDIVAGRIAYMLLWPFTQQLCDHACDSPAEGFVQPVAQLMRCANPNMRLNNDGIDSYNILAGICCEQACQCLTQLNPDGHELTPDELQTLKAQVVATTCAVMQGTHEKSHGLTGSSLSLTGFGDMLSCWRPSFCYHSEHVNQSFDLTFGPEESVQSSACLIIGRMFDRFVAAVTEDKKLTWAQLPELTTQCQAFVDGINAQYPELVKARNNAFRALLWALVQQLLMSGYWRLELSQVLELFNKLYQLDCGVFDSDFSKQLAWVILRGYAQDKKHDVRPLNQSDFAINLAALKNCFCFGFHRDSWGFEVMTYCPREAVYDYFNPFSYWPGALDQMFSRLVLSHYNEMLQFERRLFEPKTGGQVDMEG